MSVFFALNRVLRVPVAKSQISNPNSQERSWELRFVSWDLELGFGIWEFERWRGGGLARQENERENQCQNGRRVRLIRRRRAMAMISPVAASATLAGSGTTGAASTSSEGVRNCPP